MEVYELSGCASALPKEDAEAAVRSRSRRSWTWWKNGDAEAAVRSRSRRSWTWWKNGGQNNMKKDCRNIFTFVEEWKRRSESWKTKGTKWRDVEEFYIADITEEVVNKLQQWSDEHQVKTRREEFKRIFPEVDIHTLNPCTLGVKPEGGCMQSNCYSCWEGFWNKEVKEA